MNAAVLGDRLVFHGAPAGEKTLAVGRPAVVQVEETVASIPSYFVDPERACPATTLYRSVQVHGTLVAIEDVHEKAAALRALLDKHQPEGGFVPLDATHPLYAKVIASLLVFGVSLERLDGKNKLGQNRTPAERTKMLDAMWRRGAAGDVRAIDLVLAAARDTPRPAFLDGPPGVSMVCTVEGAARADEAAALLEHEYWNDRFTRAEIAEAHLASTAWVGAVDETGRLVGSARAVSDTTKRAWIYDVVVAPAARGRGIGAALVRLLLDHPAVRRTRIVELGTRDAQALYARFGFVPRDALPPRPYATTDMVLIRPRAGAAAVLSPARHAGPPMGAREPG
jgi:ribosomal protein S18 acetylase RimI-like enzyme/nitroimidazol reductase NimA-like FMN-containing flavoprotein (pyridoxamine 5'-phosphate oxidase superfamily)